MAEQKLLLGNIRGPQGAAGPNTVSSSTTTSGFENGQVLFNNNGKVGAKKLIASDVGALDEKGTAQNSLKLNGKSDDYFFPAKFTNSETDVLQLTSGAWVVDPVMAGENNLGLCFVEVKEWAVGANYRIVKIYPMNDGHQVWIARCVNSEWKGWEKFEGTVG